MAHHHHHFRVLTNRHSFLLSVHQEEISFLRSLLFLANFQLSLEHSIPVPYLRRQSKHPIQSHVINNQAILLSLSHSQSTSHHLQILGKRQGRTSQLHKLNIRTVKTLREDIHIHQYLYRSSPISSPQASVSKAVPSRTIWRGL